MSNRSDRFYPLFLLGVMGISLSICLAACSNAGRRMATVFKWNTKITVILDQDANQNSAIAVDVVSPLTDTTEGALMKMTARKWFTNKQQFSRDYLAGHDYIVVHKEYVPGTTPDPITIPFKVNTKSLIIFADYLSKGKHRYRSTLPGEDLEMHMMHYKFTVKPDDSSYGNQQGGGDGGSGSGDSSGGGGAGGAGGASSASKLKQTAQQIAKQAGQQVEQAEQQKLINQATGTTPADTQTTGTTTGTTQTDTSSSSGFGNVGEIGFGF
ncbi:MAG: hypothetical protein MI749_18850 [Desulfovibrionales bacterium]|nr:hypothetical protein [Desulfovibrionales bacterium]